MEEGKVSASIPVKRIEEAIVTQGELVCESTNFVVHRIPEIVGDTMRCALSFASPFVLLHPKSNMLMTEAHIKYNPPRSNLSLMV